MKAYDITITTAELNYQLYCSSYKAKVHSPTWQLWRTFICSSIAGCCICRRTYWRHIDTCSLVTHTDA